MSFTEILISEILSTPGAGKLAADIPAGADLAALVDLHARFLSHGNIDRPAALAIEHHVRTAAQIGFHLEHVSQALVRMEDNIKAARLHRRRHKI